MKRIILCAVCILCLCAAGVSGEGVEPWKYELTEGDVKSIDVSDKYIVAGSLKDKSVHLFEITGGSAKRLWTGDVEGAVLSVGISGNHVVAGTYTLTTDPAADIVAENYVYLFDINGDERWKNTVEGGVESVKISDGMVVVGTDAGMLYAYDLDGTPIWQFETKGSKYEKGIRSVRIDDGKVVVGSNNKNIYLFDADGELLWMEELKGIVHKVDIAENTIVAAVNTGDAYKSNTIGYVYVFDTQGVLRNRYDEVGKSILDVHIGSGHIAAGSLNGHTYLFDLDGNLKWEHQHTDVISNMIESVYVAGDYVVVGSDWYVTMYNLEDGSVNWRYKSGGTIHDIGGAYGNYMVAAGGRRSDIGVVGHIYIFDLTKSYETPLPWSVIIFSAAVVAILLAIFLYAKHKGHL